MRTDPFTIRVQLLPKSDPRYQKWRESLKKRPEPWNKGKTKEMDPRVKKISDTMRSKKIDNFKKWRDEMKKLGKIKSSYPPLLKNKETAELIGLTLGDGNIHQHKRTQRLLISFNTKYPKIIDRGGELIENVFKKTPTKHKVYKSNCVGVWIYEKKIGERLGIPKGNKKNHNLKMPKWVWKSKELLVACLIGLYNAEGSYSIHEPTCTYNLQFANDNKSLLQDVYKALLLLGYNPHIRERRVTLRKREETKCFAKLIKFEYYRSN